MLVGGKMLKNVYTSLTIVINDKLYKYLSLGHTSLH